MIIFEVKNREVFRGVGSKVRKDIEKVGKNNIKEIFKKPDHEHPLLIFATIFRQAFFTAGFAACSLQIFAENFRRNFM